ncbi:ABC transporter substrate-binding protein [Uliginosibacterium sp. H1]|uniref:ABC transporter substrate-binding protein n=1 Tax=Uliginosibacterium sp. H1 TaxID=3114757 RepID=UPI002E179902|nr:ABC transporter substrate-binding protein [Uliginosibacterium sp. H1]
MNAVTGWVGGWVGRIAALIAGSVLAIGTSAAATPVKVTLNAPFDGSNAAFFLAQQRGYYAAEGLDVQFDPSGGSGEVATRIGSGAYDFGFGDINVLMEFNAKNPSAAGKAVYMLYYRSPLSVASFAKTGINKPADLNGRKLGGALTDGAFKLFPAYAELAGVKPETVKWEYGDLRLREVMLLKGDVDAVLGFDSTMYFSFVRQGIKPEDIKFLYYADIGLDIYGNGIVVSKKMLDSNPAAVKGFVAATAKGWRDAIANPGAAIAALKGKSALVDEKLEMAKLEWLIKNQIVTAESRADGMGGVRTDRMNKAIDTLTKAFALPVKPKLDEVFSSAFLPPADIRKLP